MQAYANYNSLFNALTELSTSSTGWDAENNFLHQFTWYAHGNLFLEYSIYEGDTKEQDDNIFRISLCSKHSLFALTKNFLIFEGTYDKLTHSIEPHLLITRKLEELEASNENRAIINNIATIYLAAYKDGYTFTKFRDYFLEKRGYKEIHFNFFVGTVTFLDEMSGTEVTRMFRAETAVNLNWLQVEYIYNDFDAVTGQWKLQGRLQPDSLPTLYLKESTSIWEFLFVNDPTDVWDAYESGQLMDIVRKNLFEK